MKMNLNLNAFVKKFVIKREESLLNKDLLDTKNKLSAEINNKSVLVIGGAGTIGSSYIKALLKFKPTKLVVVDINENGLTELVRDLRSSTALNILQILSLTH
jgi:FlaA1/EpsC-like NDP-sugar epimerase